jgi:hypothetical protein
MRLKKAAEVVPIIKLVEGEVLLEKAPRPHREIRSIALVGQITWQRRDIPVAGSKESSAKTKSNQLAYYLVRS